MPPILNWHTHFGRMPGSHTPGLGARVVGVRCCGGKERGGEGGLGWELLVRRGFPYLGWCCRRQVLGWLSLRAWIGESLDSFVVPGIRLPLPPSKEGVCVPVILLTSASSEGPGRVLCLSYPRVTGFIAILILTIPRGVFTFAFLGGGLRTYV